VDPIDRKILSLVQSEARLTITAIAEKVNVSVSAAHRRLRELERSGVILGYRARLSATAVGLGFQGIVFVTMREGAAVTLAEFEAALEQVPEVIDAQRLFGDPDYLVRVVTRDLESFQQLYDATLSALPGVLRLSTTLIMKEVVSDRPLPIAPTVRSQQ